MDDRFYVKVLKASFEPQRLIWLAMHQDYYEGSVADVQAPPEKQAGELVVKHLLHGGRGHYGPLEHPQITFCMTGFPHSVMQQARTHRVGVSFDVQSMRYTGARVCDVALGKCDVEEVFYLRPPGAYTNRQGKKYVYTEDLRNLGLDQCHIASQLYLAHVKEGVAEEQARGLLPFDFRQNFVVSFNLRSALHFLDLRAKADAQPEIIQMCDLMLPHLKGWSPEVMAYYVDKRLGKAKLAP